MDKQISDAISVLNSRVKHLENIHPNITYTNEGIAHSILNALPLALLASGIAIGVVYLIKKNRIN